MRKKIILMSVLTLFAVLAVTACGKKEKEKKTLTDVRTETGEDYGDNRDRKWQLKDTEEHPYATIKADKGYVLTAQSYSTATIAKDADGDTALIPMADIDGYPGSNIKDVTEWVADDMGAQAKEETIAGQKVNVIVPSYDPGLHTIVYGNDKNSVTIRIMDVNINNTDVSYEEMAEKAIKMIEFK